MEWHWYEWIGFGLFALATLLALVATLAPLWGDSER